MTSDSVNVRALDVSTNRTGKNTNTFWLKKPSGAHKSFSISYRKRDESGKVIGHGTFSDERTELLNKSFRHSTKSSEGVEREFRRIIKSLQEREQQNRGYLPILGENEIVFKRYWELKYATKVDIDQEAAKNETIRAIKAVGELPLMSGDLHEIQNAVNKYCGNDNNKQRRVISRLKAIFKAIGRHEVSIGLSRKREVKKMIQYITHQDLPKLIDHIRSKGTEKKLAGVSVETYISAIEFAFWSGNRIGELLAIRRQSYNPKQRAITVAWQLDDKNKLRETKNKRERKTHIPKQGERSYYSWLNAPDKKNFQRKEASRILRQLTKECFSDDDTKHITFHGLRRSYACMMLRHYKFDINDVADFLGDSVVTAKKHYAGFIPDDAAMEKAVAITNAELI